MGKDKGKRKAIFSNILRRGQPEAPSKSSENDRLEPANHDTSLPDPTGGHSSTDNRENTSTAYGQSESDQCLSWPFQAPPQAKASSTSQIYNDQVSQQFQEQAKPVLLQLTVRTLWEEAAESLDLGDRKKLERLIKSNREAHAVDSFPKDRGGNSRPSTCGEILSSHYVSLIVAKAKRLRDEDKKATWRPALNKIIKGVLIFKSIGDAALKFDMSGHAALAWSVVSFGLQVAVNAEDTRGFIISSSEVVTGFMARYMEYETWFRGQHAGQEFDRRLTDVYKAILLYVMALYDYLQQCEAERLGRAIYQLNDRSISQRKKAIDDADTSVRDWLLIIMLKHNDENFTRLREMIHQNPSVSSQPSQECLQSLSFPEMENRYNDIDPAAEGTCKWLLHHDKYRDWTTCDRGLLWIKGKPGSGKSTLLRYAVCDAILASSIEDRAFVLSFFFHGRGAELQRTPLGFFRSLLHQLLRHVPDALPDLVAAFQQRCKNMGEPDKKWQWHLREMQGFFKSSLSKVLKDHSIWLFVDALDECGEENAIDLVEQFKSLLRDLPFTDSKIHICFTCRHYPILNLDSASEIRLEDENREDISTYVQAKFSACTTCMIPDTIREKITGRASGVFMWARLVTERVIDLERRGVGWKTIDAEINATPSSLSKLYLELIQGIHERTASLKLFRWICFATRPLSLDELRWAMVVDADCPHRSLQECQSTQDFIPDDDKMKRRIQTLSCGLAEIVLLYGKETVQVIHQSVKDFFVERGLSVLDSSLTSTDLAVGVTNYVLSRACIRYLTMEEIGLSAFRISEDSISEFPLLHYATTSWVSHAKQSEKRGVSQDDLLGYFAWPSETLLRLWVLIYDKIEPPWNDPPSTGSSMVHIASRYQLLGALQTILQRAKQYNVDVDSKDNMGRTPLSLAAEKGREAVTKLLLRTEKIDVDSKDNDGRTPLSWAAENGREAIVKLLFAIRKVDVNLKDVYGRTPLSWAAANGREAIVKLLLATEKIDVDSKDKDGRTPLSWASERGCEAIVKLLLATEKVDVDSKDKDGLTPLRYAVLRRHEAIIKLLLATEKVDVYSKDKDGRTPLWFAAADGYEAIVKLLLAMQKVEVDAKDKDGRTPLLYAVVNGHEGITRLLLAKEKADVDFKDKDGRTPLWWAIEKGHKAIVKLLLKTEKIDVNSKDKYNRTPLSLAAALGHDTIVELLLATEGVDVDSKDEDGRTALLYAAALGHETVAMLLLGMEKIDVDSKDKDGRTPLWWAAANGHEALVKLLLATEKVDLDSKDKDGRPPLWWAAESGHEAIVKLLLVPRCVDVDSKDNNG